MTNITERLAVFTLADRPELRGQAFSAEFAAAVPEFMRHDPTAALYYGREHLDRYLDFVVVAVDRAEPSRVVARAVSVPFAFGDAALGRLQLPDAGWDEVIRWAYSDRITGRQPGAISALEIMVLAPYRGRGVSQFMLKAMCDNASRRGFADLYAPVRPTDKHREPLTPFGDYVARQRPDGLPFDAWLRVHVRMGGRIVKVAPCSMVIAGTVAEWSRWTGMRFAESGETLVPGALSPVHISREQDHAVYIEPNVWVHHRLTPPAS
jgi:GNAT superfamily N-acetyltransferase